MCPAVDSVVPPRRGHTAGMAMTYEDAVAVQHRHEQWIMGHPEATGVGVKLRDGGLVLEVTIDPDADVPAPLRVHDLDGLPLVVEKRRYELH
jgi:hypothetical protein